MDRGDSNQTKDFKPGNGLSDTVKKGAQYEPKENLNEESFKWPGIFTLMFAQLGWMFLSLLGLLNIVLFPLFGLLENNRLGYPSLYPKSMTCYTIYVFRRLWDAFCIPVSGVPGTEITLMDRVPEINTHSGALTYRHTGTERTYLNLGSYNYLGFSQNKGPCADAAVKAIYEHGVSVTTSRSMYGTKVFHKELEQLIAEYMTVEDSVTFGMGFATNSYTLAALLTPGSLAVSDKRNHSSMVQGVRFSGVTVKVFEHNEPRSLERVLQRAIVDGQPNMKEHTPWKKILIMVEGVYSMDGTIAKLPEFIALKKKYKAYLYVDEAHSVGALGKHARGAVDYHGCDPKDVDVLMGTFTKSFGSAGGYIAGKKDLIDFIKKHNYAHKYAAAMGPPVAAQIISALKIIQGKDGTNEGTKIIDSLARNTQYFRKKVNQIGLITYGNVNSPVVPILVYNFSTLWAVLQKLFDRNIAIVGAGAPAVSVGLARLRICLSAGHTKEQLDYAIKCLDEIGSEVGIKYSTRNVDHTPIDYNTTEL